MKPFSQFVSELNEEVIAVDHEHHLKHSKIVGGVKYTIHDKKGKVGVVTLKRHPEGHHSIKVINIDNRARGKGLGSKTIEALHKRHGKITSSADGDTSDAAKKMWERVPGVKKEPDSNKSGYVYTKE